MKNCIYCNKEYIIKGMSRHLNSCKTKIKIEKTQNMQTIINKSLDISNNTNDFFNKLPNELMYHISSYLQIYINKPTQFITYYKYFTENYEMQYVSKRFFYFF